jgi:hypothetical protein
MLKKIAWLPLPILVVVIASLNSSLPRVLPSEMVFEPPLLFPISATIFISGSTIFTAYVAAKAYSKSSILALALLGASALAMGLGGLFGSWARDLPNGLNNASSIGNVRSFLSSILACLCVASTMVGLNSEGMVKKAWMHLGVLYFGVSSFLILWTIGTIQGVTPPFVVPGVGYTALRHIVVEVTILLFAASALQMIIVYFKSKADFMYWGSIAFALVAVGSYAVIFQRIAGDPISWTSRIAQYIGAIWLLVGLLSSTGSGAKEER